MSNQGLALLNVCLVSVSVACILVAHRAAKRHRVRRHAVWMCAALGLQLLFLVAFVTRFVRFGPTGYEGSSRVLYLAVVIAHEPIAVVSIPLVLCTAVLGLTRRVQAHREIARLAYPIWLFSSITGVTVWFLLYT